MKQPENSSPWWYQPAAVLIFFACVLFHIYAVTRGWSLPPTDEHEFRQTQTVLAAESISRGKGWVGYEIPILGPPWRIPFEFPLYQGVVAATSGITGCSLVTSGRAVSIVCYWLTLWPVNLLMTRWGWTATPRLLGIGLLLANPLMIFWGRSFMIETMAVLLALWMCVATEMAIMNIRWLPFALVCGMLAGAVKITTACVYLALLFPLVVCQLATGYRSTRSLFRPLLMMACVSIATIGTGVAWTRYADSVKAQNPIARSLTSSNLSQWNFGTLQQRLQMKTWSQIGEFTFDFGLGYPILLLAIVGVLWSRKYQTRALALLLAGVSGPLVFVNLYYVHTYYSTANQPLLAIFAAVGVASWHDRKWYSVALLTVSAGVFSGVSTWKDYYRFHQCQRKPEIYELAQEVRDATEPGQVCLLIGMDWEPTIPYLAGRRAIMVMSGAHHLAVEEALDSLHHSHISSIVVPDEFDKVHGFVARDWAESSLEQLLQRFRLDPQSGEVTNGFRIYSKYANAEAKRHLIDASAMIESHDYAEALLLLGSAETVLAESPELYVLKARAMLGLNRADEATDACETAERLWHYQAEIVATTAAIRLSCDSNLESDAQRIENIKSAEAVAELAKGMTGPTPEILALVAKVKAARNSLHAD
jgi:hypothetical protein